MLDILLDALIDSAKLLPFLFAAFLLMEWLEHKMTDKSARVIERAGRFGPVIGALLGAVPQCGFSVMASNLYATRIISLGTLISIYLSTSDEMLPIMLSSGAVPQLLSILAIKVAIGMLAGFVIDLLLRRRVSASAEGIRDFCEEQHCHCEHGILRSAIKHTAGIILFIFIISLLLGAGFEYLGEENISRLFLEGSLLAPLAAGLVGLIPNCAASVAVTELYLSGVLSFGSVLAGLLTGSGVALLVLFRVNRPMKQNLKILALLYALGAAIGVAFDLGARLIFG